jgi:hypothetical protein
LKKNCKIFLKSQLTNFGSLFFKKDSATDYIKNEL